MKQQTHVWPPCTAIKDLETFPLLSIKSAKGSYLYTHQNQKVIDAISSWWCKNLGHQHPRLISALVKQASCFEHVMVPNTSQEALESLSQTLSTLIPSLSKVSYASDGSSAVEMAIKLALHAKRILGHSNRTHFMTLENSYHGETGLALSVSDLSLYKKIYEPLLLKNVSCLKGVPYVSGIEDPLWEDCGDLWPALEQQLELQAPHLAAIIVEPLVQGAAGMRIYSKDFLVRLRQFTQKHDIYLICDEIFTGFGRTGLALASHYGSITPDFLCLGKGLTGGVLAMSAMLCHEDIFNLFNVNFDPERIFFHSHTFSGNALAAAVACETMKVLEDEQIYSQVQKQSSFLYECMQEVSETTGQLKNIRHIGAVIAADLKQTNRPRLGFEVFKKAMARGALLRPLGNTLYWTLPLNTTLETMRELKEITILSIRDVIT